MKHLFLALLLLAIVPTDPAAIDPSCAACPAEAPCIREEYLDGCNRLFYGTWCAGDMWERDRQDWAVLVECPETFREPDGYPYR